MLCNCRSIIPKFDELCVLNATKKPDIIFLTETWLHSNIKDEIISIPNFNIFRNDRVNKRGGGVCVYVNNECEQVKLSDVNKPDEIEACWVIVCGIIFCLIYIPPRYQYQMHDEVSHYIIDNFDNFNKLYPNFSNICLGDFNCFRTDCFSSQLSMEMIVNDTTRGNSLLDKVFVSNVQGNFNVDIFDPLKSSDHNTLFISFEKTVSYKRTSRVVFDYRSSNISRFITAVRNSDFTLLYKTHDINNKLSIFYSIIENCMKLIPTKKISSSKRDKAWITPVLKQLITKRWNAYRQRNFEKYEFYKQKIKKEIDKSKKVHYSKLLSKGKKSIWNILKEDKPKANSPFTFSGTDTELAEAIKENLQKITHQSNKSYNVSRDSHCQDDLIFSEEEVQKVLLQIDPKKASNDPIPSTLLRLLSDCCYQPITHIFNSVMIEKIWPDQWKCANIIPLPKDKTPNYLNIRPISILSALNKCLEKLLKDRLLPFYLKNIDSSQFGFVPMGSTTAALIALLNKVSFSIDSPTTKAVSIISFDFTKAFDKVDHQLLLNKLSSFLPHTLILIIANYLKGRKQRVQINNVFSSYCDIDCGVPQGSVLSPLLFGLFIRDLISTPKSFCFKYADDSTFVIPHSTQDITQDIQSVFLHVSNWCTENKLHLNLKKTNLLIIKKQPVIYNTISSLAPVDEIKILGVTLQSNLKWTKHVTSITNSASSSLYLLRKCRSIFSQKQLVALYNSYILSKMCYAGPSYAYLPQSLQNYFVKLYKRSHHVICGKECKEQCLIHPLEQIKKTSVKLFNSILTESKHPLHSLAPPRLVNSNKLLVPLCRSERTKKTFIPQMVAFYNNFK